MVKSPFRIRETSNPIRQDSEQANILTADGGLMEDAAFSGRWVIFQGDQLFNLPHCRV